jgi:D-arabinose 1-dehydrogenase-like Zn-dependent alcohol dehydrogenase
VAGAITEPVDVVLNLVAASDAQMVALTGLLRPGGVIVTTATPATTDPDRGVRAIGMQLRADAGQLATIAKKVDAGEIRVEVTTYPLSETATVHEHSAAGRIRGKVVLNPGPLITIALKEPP